MNKMNYGCDGLCVVISGGTDIIRAAAFAVQNNRNNL